MWGLIGKATGIFFLIFIVYIGIEFIPLELLDNTDRVRILTDKLEKIGFEAWYFFKPLLQLAIIVLIIEYLARKYRRTPVISDLLKRGDTKSLLAIIVVTAFCISAVAGTSGVANLEDIALSRNA